jgi:hypothetical protein
MGGGVMRAGVCAGLVVVLLAGCNSERSEPVRSQGARDSAIAESVLPGAAGVKRALAVSDSADARRALEDSIMWMEEQ